MQALEDAPGGTHEASILWGQTLRWHKGALTELGHFEDPLHAVQRATLRGGADPGGDVQPRAGDLSPPSAPDPEETQAWIQDGPAFSLPLAERFLKDPESFAERQGKPRP